MKLSDVWSLQIRGQQPAKGAVKEVTMVLEMINLLDRLYFSCPTRLSLREQRNIVISDVLDRFNMMTMMIVQETDNVTRYIQHGRKMMMMMMMMTKMVMMVMLMTDLKFFKKITRPNFRAKEFYTLKMRKSRLLSVIWPSFG